MGKRKTQLSDYSDDDGKTTKKRTPKKANEKKSMKDTELEEGEVTDSESSDYSEEEFNDGYDSSLMGDEEDRLRLAQMTEKEREQEIFRRVEARETMRTRFNIEKKLKREQRRELKRQRLLEERNASPSISDSRDSFPEKRKTEENSSRPAKKSTSKTRRDDHEFSEKENRPKEEPSKKDRSEKQSKLYKTKLKASEVYSDDSDSSEEQIMRKSQPKKKPVSSSSSSSSESESDSNARVRSIKPKVQYVSTRAQLNQMKLSRYKLERFLNLPFFKRIAIGSFVKVAIAFNKDRSVYRICEVIDLAETEEPYQLGDIQTNKMFKLKHGTLERNFRLEFVSNMNFSDGDFVKWRDTCTLHGVKMPTVEQMELKVKDLKEALLFELTMEEIEKIVNEKERFKNSPYEFAMKRTQLEKECESARAAGDSMRAGELQDELNEVEERAANLDQFRTKTISSIKYINDRNQRKGVKEEEKDSKEQKVKSSPAPKMRKMIVDLEDTFELNEINDSTADSSALSDATDRETDSPSLKMNSYKEGKTCLVFVIKKIYY